MKYGQPHPDLICKVMIVTESALHPSDCLPILKIQVILLCSACALILDPLTVSDLFRFAHLVVFLLPNVLSGCFLGVSFPLQ